LNWVELISKQILLYMYIFKKVHTTMLTTAFVDIISAIVLSKSEPLDHFRESSLYMGRDVVFSIWKPLWNIEFYTLCIFFLSAFAAGFLFSIATERNWALKDVDGHTWLIFTGEFLIFRSVFKCKSNAIIPRTYFFVPLRAQQT